MGWLLSLTLQSAQEEENLEVLHILLTISLDLPVICLVNNKAVNDRTKEGKGPE